jgi:LemA protein
MGTENILVISIVLFVVLGGGISFVIAVYNGLVQVKNNVEKAFNNIDVLLQQRFDELPRLVEAAKGYLKHERDLLKDIVDLRMRYRQASGPDEKVDIENRLSPLLSMLNVLVEQYPDLKAIESFNHIQLRVSAIEEQIADRRELFNDSVNIYNTRIERFPEVLFARMLHYTRKGYLIVPDDKKRVVSLGLDI